MGSVMSVRDGEEEKVSQEEQMDTSVLFTEHNLDVSPELAHLTFTFSSLCIPTPYGDQDRFLICFISFRLIYEMAAQIA